ncbi:Mobile element protein [Amycolatopsis camponoti]|uniref:Mobile element protein n=1 Tax=Amycolatopsis camponoti TaxID=2606593 RepID=A0A6I8LRY0_9PSEU|nr:Mobile element protein [Amycolatopsis camponoti]
MTAQRHRGLTEQAANAAVDQACRLLRLPTIGTQFSRYGRCGRPRADVLPRVSRRAAHGRVRRPGPTSLRSPHQGRRVPAGEVVARPRLRHQLQRRPGRHPPPLATCEWVKKGLPLCLIGDSRYRQITPADRTGTEAAMNGFRVRCTLATKLVNELVGAADDIVLAKTIARYGRVDLLCIDELGYMELDRRGAELFFQVLTEREEKASVAIASNESFGGWTKTFTDPRLCAAIVDRLTYRRRPDHPGRARRDLRPPRLKGGSVAWPDIVRQHQHRSHRGPATCPGHQHTKPSSSKTCPGYEHSSTPVRTSRTTTGTVGLFCATPSMSNTTVTSRPVSRCTPTLRRSYSHAEPTHSDAATACRSSRKQKSAGTGSPPKSCAVGSTADTSCPGTLERGHFSPTLIMTPLASAVITDKHLRSTHTAKTRRHSRILRTGVRGEWSGSPVAWCAGVSGAGSWCRVLEDRLTAAEADCCFEDVGIGFVLHRVRSGAADRFAAIGSTSASTLRLAPHLS